MHSHERPADYVARALLGSERVKEFTVGAMGWCMHERDECQCDSCQNSYQVSRLVKSLASRIWVVR